MRKTICLFLSIAIILCSVISIDYCVYAETQSGTCGDNLTWTLDDEGTLTISGTGNMNNYKYYNSIPWWLNSSSIKTVLIDNGVTSISDYAFYDCTSLTSVIIPDSVIIIGAKAFEYCSSLNRVNINSIEAWCKIRFIDSFEDSGTDIYNVSNPLWYAHNLYLNDELVTDLVIPNTIAKINNYAFRGCSSLTSVAIPDNVTSIGDYAFEGCSSLTSVTIPDNVTSIGDHAFSGCSSLTSVTIPDSVIRIKSYAFYECYALDNIVILNSNCNISDSYETINGSTTIYGYKGSTAYKYASKYNRKFVDLDELSQNSKECEEHTIVIDNGYEKTCIKSGLTKGSHCSVCGKVIVEQQIIPADHNYRQTVIASTCEIKGYTLNKCSVCGESFKDNYTELAQHSYNSVTTKQPTCTEKGILKHTCVICGDTYNTDIDALGHTEVIDKAVASTYTKTGKTEGKHCSVCKAVLVAQKTVAKKTLAKPTSVKATAVSKGFKLTWKKVSVSKGYEIQYSTSSKFSSPKKITITKNSTLSKSITKLTSKKKYYVRIRAYYKDSNGTAYSSWVSTYVTTKK